MRHRIRLCQRCLVGPFLLLLSGGAHAEVDLWEMPLLKTTWDTKTHVVKLSPGARAIIGQANYWISVAAVLPDSGLDALSSELEFLRIDRASVLGHELTKGATPSPSRPTYWLWYASFGSSVPVDAGCGLQPSIESTGGTVAHNEIPICDEQCFETAIEPTGFLSPTVVRQDHGIRVSWSPMGNADAYGVLIWEREPRLEDIVDGLQYASEETDLLSMDIEGLHTSGATVGVWVRNAQPTGQCKADYGEFIFSNVNARYYLDLVRVEEANPSAVSTNSWAEMKRCLTWD